MKRGVTVPAVVAMMFAAAADAQSPVSFHVAPDGDDTNPGTLAEPSRLIVFTDNDSGDQLPQPCGWRTGADRRRQIAGPMGAI